MFALDAYRVSCNIFIYPDSLSVTNYAPGPRQTNRISKDAAFDTTL
jgi:hypothetical protein